MNNPSVERLRELLKYDTETGVLVWLYRPASAFPDPKYELIWNSLYAGTEAGTVSKKDGYRYLHIDGVRRVAHRIAWAMVHGRWPAMALDHIDQNRLNNRMSNLREAGYGGNALNRSMKSDNTSGCTGVDPKPAGNWHARITFRGEKIFLGAFDKFEDAVRARKQAEERLGFHSNHGRAKQ